MKKRIRDGLDELWHFIFHAKVVRYIDATRDQYEREPDFHVDVLRWMLGAESG